MEISKRNTKILVLLLSLLSVLVLVGINRDLFEYEEVNLIGRNFSGTEDDRGEYRLTSLVTLKPALYQISFIVANAGSSDHWAIFTPDGLLLEGAFIEGAAGFTAELVITERPQQVSAGVIYAGESQLEVCEVNFSSGHVLYRDSLLRHLTLSMCWVLLVLVLLLRLFFPERYALTIGRFLTPTREKVFLFILLMTIIACCPFYQSAYVKGDDSTFHIGRIEGVKATLEAGIFPTRIHLFTLNNYGFASGMFYSDFFLYFPALLRLLGFDFVICYKIFIFVLTFLSLFSIYLCVTKMGGSRFAGFAAVILYAFNAYRLIDVYYRGAVGEILAFIFVPLIILGLYFIFTGKPERWWVLTLGLCGLVLSHLISTLLCLIFMAVFFLFSIVQIISRREILSSLLKAGTASLLLTCWFWLPMLEQMMNVDIVFNINPELTVNPPMPFKALLANSTIWEVPVQPYIGYPLLFCPLLFCLPRFKKAADQRIVVITYAFALLALICSTDVFPWQYFSKLHWSIQFPWRFLILAIPLLTVAAGLLIDQRLSSHKSFLFLGSIICVAFAWPVFQNAIQTRGMESRGYKLENNRISDEKYLPVGANKEFIDKNRNTVGCSDLTFVNLWHTRDGLSFSFDYEVSDDEVDFVVPLLYYKGYNAYLTDTLTGEVSSPETEKNSNGLILVRTAGVHKGNLYVRYEKTFWQWLADGISLFTLVGLITLALLQRRKVKL